MKNKAQVDEAVFPAILVKTLNIEARAFLEAII
jgi:hypothetical protein